MPPFKSHQDYRDAWNTAFIKNPSIPLNIDIELASVCNLACPFCFWGEDDFNQEMKKPSPADRKPIKRLMPTAMALKLIDDCAKMGVPALKFNWRGESTIHPDYSKILQYAANKNAFFDLLVNTNANCKDHAIDGLMAATKVMVSLDSFEVDTYRKMRVGGDLARACVVVEELLQRLHPNVWVRRVVTKDNQDEDFKGTARSLWGNSVKVSEHHCFDRNIDAHHALHDPNRFERTYCGYPSQRIMVASDGQCFPCCVDYNGTMPLGTYPKQDLIEVWSGVAMNMLRINLRENQLPTETCKNCTSWMAYKSKNRENVQDKNLL